MIKNCMRYQIYWALAVKKPKMRFLTLKLTLQIQLICFLLLLAVSGSAWGQFFESPPRVIDDANDDIVFSPNEDDVQDNLIISFVTNGFHGDYRIIIDVHGPGAVGRPDGKFDIEDDWFVKGKVGSGQLDLQPPADPKIIHQEWDGMDRAPSQETPPNARPVGNGSYEILVETDAFEDGVVDITDFTYQSSKLTAVIDVDAPQVSSTASHLFFSPNSDAIKDNTTIAYTLSEHLAELSLEFANLESQPAIKLTHITRGRHSFVWNGLDGLRTPLVDGTYNLRLRGIDNGGNVTTFDVGPVQIDTRAPTFSQITPSQNAYLKTSVTTIVVEFNPANQESPIDFDPSVTTISLQDAGGEILSGIARSDVANSRLTLTLDNPLDTISENGTYTAVILGADAAGNHVVAETSFNFDTVPPTLEQIRTDRADFRPNGAVNTEITFVEVDIDDNIDGGLNLSAATIALNGPSGAIFGNQTFGGDSSLRWDLKVPLVADGSEDGIYTITVSAADRAGNTADFGEISFVYDTQVPRLISLTPNLEENSFHLGGGAIFRSQPLSRIVAGLSDGDGSGVNIASTRVEIFSTGATGVDEISLTGIHHPNPTDGTLVFLLSPPLENQDGTQDGAYTIRVTLVDVAGNSDTSQVNLIYDTEAPTIVSTTPKRDATVAMLSEVSLLLDDRLSGVDFSGTSIRLVRDDVEVRATSSNNGKDKTVLTLSDPLATDGSDDGEYRIEITPVDRAENASARIERRFFFTSQRPEIRLNAPAKEEVNALTTIDAQLFDYVGSGIDFSAEDSTVVVTRADDTVVPAASVEADKVNNRLLWMAETPLPRDGSADGVYTVSVIYEDLVGQNFTQNFALTFDTQLPNVLQTTPAAGARVNQLGTIAVKFAADLSGVDFSAAQVRLLDPNGVPVRTNRSDNGVDTITLRVQDLQTSAANGVYIIEVTPVDSAGNVADSPILSGFTYTSREPLILLQPPGNLSTNQLNQITATLEDYVGPGIDFNTAETSIFVRNTNGALVAAHPIQSNEAELQLTWTALSRLPRDGSADGEYKVVSRFAENLGLGTTSPATFERISTLIIDTQPAQIASTVPTPEARITQLEQATIVLKDNLSGVDFDRTVAQLLDSANNPIPMSMSNDGAGQITLSFDAFKTDGSADGVYRLEITPADLAGNVGGLSTVEFVYATRVPEIAMLTPADASVVNRVSEIRVLIGDNSGEGIDFEKSKITLTDTNNANVHGILRNDGEGALTLEVGLPTDGTADGEYTVNLNLVDNLGIEAGYTRQFTYDSVPPLIVAESRPPRENRINDNRIFVEVEVTDASPVPGAGSGVDFNATTVQLQDSNGEPVAGETKDDGVKMVTFTSAELASVGVYTLTIVVADRAGNVSVPQRFTYRDEIKPPRVVSIMPPTKSRVNRLTEISTVLEDQSGAGIDFSPTGSTIELRSPNDVVVGGTVADDGVDTMTLKLIAPLLTDGSDDGVYTITVQPVDQRGVNGEVRQFTISYDTQQPRVQSVSHIDMTANVSNVKDSVRRIEAELIETGSGLDFERSYVQLWRHTEAERVLVPGILDYDAGSSLWWQLDSPLARDGSDDGAYSVEVKAVDNAGNVEEKEYRFLYDTRAPIISSFEASVVAGNTLELDIGSTPSLVEVPIHQIHLVFSDGSGSGIDVLQTTVQFVHPNGVAIGATQQDNGAGQITLSFDAFKTDGSADGVYRLEITPADLAGNVGGLSTVEFVYATRVPEIAMLTPADASVVNRVSEIRVLIGDNSGEGIDFEKSKITLTDTNNANVHGILRNDGEGALTLEVGLPTDGTADGEYTVNLNLVDNLGIEAGYTRQFTYDSVPPLIVAESRPPRENRINDNRIFVEVEVTDASPVPGAGSGVDFNATTVQLQDSNGEPVAGETKDDGVKMVTFTSAELASVGVYTLTIVVADRAGNVSVPQRFTYRDEIKPPRVVSIMPPTKSRVNRLTEISTVLEDQSGAGIDFSPTGSTIELRSPNDVVVGGTVADDGVDTMTLKLIAPLLTDGSDDGVYTITVQPVDQRGVNGEVRQFTISYDTQQPRVQSVSHIDMTANVSNVKDSVRRIEAELIETGSGLDFERSYVQLWRHTEAERVLVPGILDYDAGSSLWWQLDSPLARDGSDDGAYSVEVKAVDNAGNVEEKEYRFLYDTRAPIISSFEASVVAGNTLELDIGSTPSLVEVPIHQIHLVFSDGSGSGIDVLQTTVQFVHPNGVAIGATQQDNGAGQITLSFDAFKTDGSADGVYRLEITPADLAGNVGGLSTVEFVYATRVPEIAMLTPADASVVNRVSEIRVLIGDNSGEGIDFEKSKITLTDTNNANVHGILRNDGEGALTLEVGLPTDGTADGEYTVNLNLVDNLGIEAGYTRQFTYDSVPPLIVAESRPPRENRINDNRIFVEVEVTDASPVPGAGSGVDFNATTVQLQDSNGEPVAGETKDDGVKMVTFTSAELASVGVYTLTIVVADRAGNVSVPQRFTYRDEIKPPRVVSIMPPTKSRVNRLTEISTVLEDQSGAGIDFSPTGSTIELRSPNDVVVGGTVADDGVDTMTLKLIAPLLTDGSDDGVYTITVQPVDQRGVNGEVRQFTISYDTQQPRVQSVSHIDMTANVSNVKDSVRRIEAELIETGSGLDFERSYVQLWRHTEAERVLVPGILDYDAGSSLWWQLDSPLARDGSDDGAYSVEVKAVDNAGNVEEKEYRLLYDTRAPVINSVQASVVARDTLELDTGNTPDDYRIIVELEITDAAPLPGVGSGVDFDATTIQLQDSDGEPIVGEKKNDDVKMVTFTSAELASVGVYTLTVVVADRAGNVSVPQRFTYRDEIKPPRVVSIMPPTKSRVNRLTEISTVLEDQSGTGIDFSPTGSTIELRSPNDVVVGGTVADDGVDTMTLKLIAPLLTDGSDDGVYTITVQPVDQRGVNGEVRQFTISYDTQQPRIQSVSHIDMTANVSNVKDSVRRIEVGFDETGSGIDFERSYVQLWRHTEGERVLVLGAHDDDDGSLLWWQLDSALARSGSDDGVYSVEVKAVDNAGNVEEKEYRFLYDTQVPVISSVDASVVAGNTLELDIGSTPSLVEVPIHQIHLDFSDGSGSGIDVSQTTVQLIHSNGMAIASTQQNDGIETVSLRFNPLRDDGADDGRYLIRVTPIDLAGNTFTSPVEFQFLYATRRPDIVSTTPAEFTSVNLLNSVSAVLLDYSGEGIDFDRSSIGLHNSEGNLIDGRQHVDAESSVITWELDKPLSRDGVDDDEYSIRLVVFSGMGSELRSSKTFLYDTQIPRIVSVSAGAMPSTSIPVNGLEVLNQSFAQMTVRLSDERTDIPDEGQIPTSGIDFVGTVVRLLAPNNVQKGVSVGDDGEAQLFVSFAPLVQPGAYTLEITPRDLAGNTSGHPIQYNFSLDLAKPRVDSVAIGEHTAPVAFVNQLEQITAKLVDPNGVGLDLTTGGSTLSVMGPNGVVEGLQEGNGIDELVWTPLYLPSDGTADGRYTVTVTAVDSLGLSGTPARYQFILDTQKPELIEANPIDLSLSMSNIGEQIIQISAQVTDVGPAGLDMLTQEIQLQDSNGSSIPSDLTSDDDTQVFLTLAQPLATNGSDDGEYSVIISLGDRAGNTLKIEHTFVYDTQAPTLVNTDPAGDLIRDDLISITADLSDSGGSGIDFSVSQLTLFNPSGNQVNGKLSNDGVGRLILQLDELAEDGSYRIRVLAVDRAGNGVSAPFDRTFLFSTNLPTVVLTIPVTAPTESAFTRTPPNQVEVEFQSSPNLSTVKLIHPNGTNVPGQQIRDGNRLIYRLSRELASDGSDDGSYTILVTPVNSAGRSGEQQQYNFIYDTVLPEVDGILPVVESPGINNALNEILAAVTDANPSSSIDWDELNDSWMTFEKIGAEKKIRGRLSTDRDQIISFRLESPLASDGSQDGKYRVTVMPRDRAGNAAIPTLLEFFLDTRPPIIHTDSLLINDRPLFANTNHPDYPSADGSGGGVVIQARMSDLGFDGKAGLGVDLSQSSIAVNAPDGTSVNGNLIQNGTDTIVFRSGPLITQGFYQVEIASVGLDVDGLGFAPTDSITTQFLHETTEPVAELTDFGGKTSLTDQPLPLRGTATDPVSVVEETGNEQGGTISASGIAFVEIVGTGPDGEPIEPVLAVDKSSAAAEPWSSWSLDFLPARSGGYNLEIRVTDRAGNVAVYDGVNVNLSVSLTYRGSTYGWPNPLKHSTGDRAHFSFDVNIPSGAKINMTLSIYDFAGDLVFENTFSNIAPGRDSDQLVTWNLENQAGAAVARGVYVFRLEAEDIATKNRSNAVGKLLVIE